MIFMEMILRTTATFFVLLLLARLMGKEQVSQLTFFNYITGITIGSIAAEMAGQSETPFWNGMTSLVWWTVLSVGVSLISLKSLKLKKWVDDEPSIVIKRGKIQENVLKKKRLPVEDLLMLLRLQGVFSFQEVAYAVLETNGQLSIMKTEEAKNPTKSDLGVAKKTPKKIPAAVFIDGNWMTDACHEIGVAQKTIEKQLKDSGYKNLDDVFLVQWQEDGTLYVDKKTDVKQS
ncbi:DUF421 domain-containing protein [Paenisporosarcina cavernae]|uniref:DUF421 domain-containing protein n=1 Tax=Paenisporosarcina cavernae TaxID=2320858 RepID=A0A385YXD8_9BACL|nr:DUF421 domain-containing protein [Paenisporosarcina cavernae]AYC30577.1 DUF421 domain-containing protein [Paenisporosarcina cavernae]